jgi:hypothetical protein
VRGRKGTYLYKSISSFMALWMGMKEIPELLQGRGSITSVKGQAEIGSTGTSMMALMT